MNLRPAIMGALAAVALLSLPAAASARLSIAGNLLFERDEILAMGGLSPGARSIPDPDRFSQRLLDELHRRGYELARVWIELHGTTLAVTVDEGRLDRIVFLGRGAVTSVLMKLSIRLPRDIFHRPTLDQQIERLKGQYGLVSASFRVVRAAQKRTVTFQLDDLGTPFFKRQVAAYDLYVSVASAGGTGLSVDLKRDARWGWTPEVAWDGDGLLASADQWRASASIGTDLYLDSRDRPSLDFRHAGLELRYTAPPLLFSFLRPSLETGFGWSEYIRRDLALTRWDGLETSAVLTTGFRLFHGLELDLEAGLLHRHILSVTPLTPGGATPITAGDDIVRWHYGLGLDWDTQPYRLRRDIGTRLEAGIRRIRVESGWHTLTGIELAGAVEFDWDFLRYGLRLRYAFSEVPFYEDEPLSGPFQKGFYSRGFFTSRVASLSIEYRFSLYRDRIHLGAFNDLSLFRGYDIDQPTRSARDTYAANSLGPSIHFLLFDMLQLDLGYAFGIGIDGLDRNLYLRLYKVY